MDNRKELTISNNEENTESFQDDTVRLETVVRVSVPSSCSSCSSDCTNSSYDDEPLTDEERKGMEKQLPGYFERELGKKLIAITDVT